MELLNSPDLSELRSIISKLVNSKRFSNLSPEEVSLLSHFAGVQNQNEEKDKAKTLLSWIWESLVKYEKYSEDRDLIDLGLIESIMIKDGRKSYSRSMSGESMCILLKRTDLLNIVHQVFKSKKSSASGKEDKIRGAIILAGLTGLNEFEQEFINICLEKGDESDFTYRMYGNEIIACAFISLIMLNSKSVEKIADRLRLLSEDIVRGALFLYFEEYPDRMTEKDISELHDYLVTYDEILRFPNILFKVYKDDIPGLNGLILSKSWEHKGEFIWQVICPAIFSYKNEQLLRDFISEESSYILHTILSYAILKDQYWIFPVLFDHLSLAENKLSESDKDCSLLYTPGSIVPMFILTAAALSERENDWLRSYLSSNDESVKIPAILGCIGKKEFLDDFKRMKNSSFKLTSVTAAFVLAIEYNSSSVYLDSLLIEMKVSGLDSVYFPFIYCLLKKYSKPIPPELEDIWLIVGPKNYEEAGKFYEKYPYRLISWLLGGIHSRGFVLDNLISSDIEVADRLFAILKEIADSSYIGLLKSFLYVISDDKSCQLVLSVLVELEQDNLSIETKTLKKIFLSNSGEPINFEEEEIPFALNFYFLGRFIRKAEIISSLTKSSEYTDTLLRVIIETCSTNEIDAAIETGHKHIDSNDDLIVFENRISEINQSGISDKVQFARLISNRSDKLRTDILNSFYISDLARSETGIKKPLTDDDIHLLLFLFRELPSNSMAKALEILTGNIDQVGWLKESVNRWLLHMNPYSEAPDELVDIGLLAASMIKSEEYLPEFIKLLNRDISYGSIDKEKVLDIIKEILDANPDSKFIFLRADDPEKVKKFYGLNLKKEYNFNSDNKMESIKFISLALTKKIDKEYVKEKKGLNVSINHENQLIDQALIQRSLTRAEFEKIALHLSVTYTDDSTGLIFAEVMDPIANEPSGEILNAILQNGESAIFTMSWC